MSEAQDAAMGSDERYRPGYELVAERILGHIGESGLKPGDRLPTEKGLAALLGVTHNVTREALKVLAAMGRVNVRKGAGIFVASPVNTTASELLADFRPTDMEHVLMLLDYRALIETETTRLAATAATPLEVRSIRETAAASLDAARVSPEAFAAADALFHDAVGEAAHNVFLHATVSNIRRYSHQTSTFLFHGEAAGPLETAGEQHLAIAQAIGNGDPERAMHLMSIHLDTTKQQLESRIHNRLFNEESAPAARSTR